MRKNSIRRMGAALLALALLAGCGRQALPDGGSVSTLAPAPTDTPAPQATAVPAPTATPERETATVDLPVQPEWTSADGIHADVDFGDMQWFLYDLGPFEDRAEELSRAEDEEAAETLYRWLLTEYTRLQTLDELAWIDFYYYGGEECSDRCQTTDEMLSTAGDTLHLAVSRVLNGPLGESFAAWLGEEDSYMLSDYQEMSDRELELSLRETELTLEYNDLLMDENMSQARLGLEAADIFLELGREIVGHTRNHIFFRGLDFLDNVLVGAFLFEFNLAEHRSSRIRPLDGYRGLSRQRVSVFFGLDRKLEFSSCIRVKPLGADQLLLDRDIDFDRIG